MPELRPLKKQSEERLDSWKEIASFLERDVRTVQRWEKAEGLPVHRHQHSKLDSIYAFRSELSEWQKSRRRVSAVLEPPAPPVPQVFESATPPASKSRTPKVGAVVIVLAGVMLAGTLLFWSASRGGRIHTNLTAVPLSTYLGEEQSPALSPDGTKVAFVWNGERQDNFDIYVKSFTSPQAKRLTESPDVDYSPVWSPDGKWLAFCRGTEELGSGLWVVSASGETKRKLSSLYHGDVRPSDRALSWSPDGAFLVVGYRFRASNRDGLHLLNVKTGQESRLTDPKPGETDEAPAVSPNGKWVAFSRDTGLGVSAVYLLPFHPGSSVRDEPKRLSWRSLNHVYAGNPAWTPDSKQVVFDSNKGGNHHLWIAAVTSMGRAEDASVLPFGDDIGSPSISPAGQLAFTHETLNVNIWKVNLQSLLSGKGAPPIQIVSSTRIQDNPSVSPDGKRLAFVSNRSGYAEIWTSTIDGANAAPLTDMRVPVTGSPSWSPDGRSIAYDSRVRVRPQIFSIAATGGKATGLTDGVHLDVVPHFAPDGKWIYFSSNRSGEMQLWKMPATGGVAQQVTEKGGFAGMFSPDGAYLYYSRTNGPFSSLWRKPMPSGEERCIARSVPNRAFAPVNDGVFYRSIRPDKKQELLFLKIGSNKPEPIFTFQKSFGVGMSVSPNGRSLFFAQEDQRNWDLQLVQGFWR